MPTRPVLGLLVSILAATAARATAQDSPFGIRGLGVPGRFESVRARATGGAFAAFDPLSALTEASLVGIARLTATAAGAGSYLTDDIGGVRDSRRTGRFPLFQVLGPVWHGVVVGGGFATYLDRSYSVTIADTLLLDGSQQAVTDNLSSDGGVTDLRLVAARRFGQVAFGVGFHLLTGSTRVRAERTFTDTSVYRGTLETDEIAYSGVGYSASAQLTVSRALQIAGFWRTDTRLHSEVGGVTTGTNDLPVTVGGAVRWQPAPQASIAASLVRRSWASAIDSGAFSTTTWSAGAELGSGRLPLRLGVHGGELPFGPGRAPRELAVAVGSGLTLAGGRGLIDLAVERLWRSGGGLTETGWVFLLGVTVRP